MDKLIATMALTISLGMCGLSFIIWKAVEGWQDTHGLVVGIILVVCTVLQALFSVGWIRKMKSITGYTVTADQEMQNVNGKAMEATM